MKHLSPQQFIALLDGTPDAGCRSHLSCCVSCQGEVADLQAIRAAVSASAMVPEPSPLFWNHFSSRVHEAITVEPLPAQSWWRGLWRPTAGLGVAMACLALVVMVRISPPGNADHVEASRIDSAVASSNFADAMDPSGVFVAHLAAGASWEDLQRIVPTSTDGAADMMASLTPAERSAFARLLKARMDGEE